MPRVRTGAVLRALLLVALFAAWLQLMLSATHRDSGQAYQVYVADVRVETVQYDSLTLDEMIKRMPDDGNTFEEELLNSNETSEQVLALVPQELHKFLNVRHRNGSYGGANSSTGDPASRNAQQPRNISEMRRDMARYNDAQTVLNEELFGPVLNDTVIIAIQVHTRLTYLRHLIVSLAQARSIDKALLVFSHDYFDDSINALVQSIDFARVVQIYYPYSIQTHPHEFPGVDPNDCPRNAKFEDAVKLQCNNALHPDGHGHYREAKYAQTKHHWWWKANRIFNQLRATRDHTGYVVFLEEDHYVAEDFLHVLKLMQQTAERKCPYCEILCLGTYLKTYQYHVNSDKVEITPWHSSVHNMGMAFNRTVWRSMMALSDQFCLYDDYNWDYSLLHLSQNRPGEEKFKVMVCKGPRVFHIGECGFHHKKSNCDTNAVVSKVARLLRGARAQLYPGRLVATIAAGGVKAARRLRKGNGGWGDVRDHELCTNMTREGRDLSRYTNLY